MVMLNLVIAHILDGFFDGSAAFADPESSAVIDGIVTPRVASPVNVEPPPGAPTPPASFRLSLRSSLHSSVRHSPIPSRITASPVPTPRATSPYGSPVLPSPSPPDATLRVISLGSALGEEIAAAPAAAPPSQAAPAYVPITLNRHGRDASPLHRDAAARDATRGHVDSPRSGSAPAERPPRVTARRVDGEAAAGAASATAASRGGGPVRRVSFTRAHGFECADDDAREPETEARSPT